MDGVRAGKHLIRKFFVKKCFCHYSSFKLYDVLINNLSQLRRKINNYSVKRWLRCGLKSVRIFSVQIVYLCKLETLPT
jgi:hypothetical protein